MATLCSSRSKDDLQPRKYFFFIYVLFVLHVFYIPFNLCESEYYIEGEIVQSKFNLSLCLLPIYYWNIMAD